MFGRILLLFLCPMLVFGSGCARSYDGTVIIPKPLDVRRFWDRAPPQTKVAQSQVETTGVFPVAPEAPRRTALRRATAPTRHVAKPANPSAQSSGPEKPLSCRNVSQPGKRFRVVCE
ncbi:MAG: hypothetical protein E5W82_14865 [Mesorhizobium sp.]|nr:MAG: hypothetical protein E5W91_18920 [Mesorhizobium sp.]TIS87572.1 MAG: hypothetical protein E5W89_24265 [Mesorhizobium sp.]TJW12897.1 MAG: hypothetical protein E5W82_14865 [Mesorhizobium sp.]